MDVARCVGHLLHELCAGLLHVRESKVSILNLKGIAAPLWAVRFWQTPSMCCTSRCIGMLWTCWNPSVPPHLATSRHLGRTICVRTPLIPQDNFSKDMSLHLCGDVSALFRPHSANRFEREDAGCAIQRTTLHERRSLLRSCTLWADALPAALGTFGVHSQAGDKMQESSAITMKTILDEDARKALGAWVARLTGQGFVLSVLAKNCDCQTDPRLSLHGGTFCDSIFVALSCSRGEFSPDGLYDHSWASVTPTAGNYTTNFSQYTSDVVCVCMFADLFLSWRGVISLPCPDWARPTLSGEDVGCDQEGG